MGCVGGERVREAAVRHAQTSESLISSSARFRADFDGFRTEAVIMVVGQGPQRLTGQGSRSDAEGALEA
jgi:hypothetical protein